MLKELQQVWLSIYVISALLNLAVADSASKEYDVSCPPGDVSLVMAGVKAGNRLVDAWQSAYTSKYCPNFNVTFENNAWDSSAARLCANSLIHDPADVASMSGSFFLPQASTTDGWSFQCKRSKQEREAVLVLLAHRGIVAAVSKNSKARDCIDLLGGGLTEAQLRWMYTSFNTKDLIANGWNPSSVPYLDDDDNTHLWSELHENCTASEILLALEEEGEGKDDGMEYIFEHILTGRGEKMREVQSGGDSREKLDEFMKANPTAISLFHLYDALSTEFHERNLMTIGIKNGNNEVIVPFGPSFEDETYPFLKRVNLGLVKNLDALEVTRPFLEFAYSDEGTKILKYKGYWPIEGWRKTIMYSRIGSDLGLNVEDIQKNCGPLDDSILIAGGNTVLPVVKIWTEFYKLGCPVHIVIEGGRSSDGVSRVCASAESGYSVDVGMMSRSFTLGKEAVLHGDSDYVFDCINDKNTNDKLPSVIQVEVAVDGVVVIFAAGSSGERCVRLIGGLTLDQIRWMYSNYSDEELENTGWDSSGLTNSDFDSNTHLWSELDYRCDEKEIRLIGDFVGEGTFAGFAEYVFKDRANGETVANNRPIPYYEAYGAEMLYELTEYDDAAAFGGYSFYIVNQEVYWAAPVATEAGQPYIAPTEETMSDGSYAFARKMYLAIRDEESVIRKVTAALQFGYNHPELIKSTGYAPLDKDRVEEMMLRLRNGPYSHYETEEDDEENESQVGVIMGIIIGVIVFGILVVLAIRYWRQ